MYKYIIPEILLLSLKATWIDLWLLIHTFYLFNTMLFNFIIVRYLIAINSD